MKKFALVFTAVVLTSFVPFRSAQAQPPPQPQPYIIMVFNINGQLYNIDQNYGIYGPFGYLGQLVTASTPSGWMAVRNDGAQFPVFSCR